VPQPSPQSLAALVMGRNSVDRGVRVINPTNINSIFQPQMSNSEGAQNTRRRATIVFRSDRPKVAHSIQPMDGTRVFAVVPPPDEAAESQPRVWSIAHGALLNRRARHQSPFNTFAAPRPLTSCRTRTNRDRKPLYKCKSDYPHTESTSAPLSLHFCDT